MENYYTCPIPTGWRCPQCGRIYSPTTSMCFYCEGKTIKVDCTTTNPTVVNTPLSEQIKM